MMNKKSMVYGLLMIMTGAFVAGMENRSRAVIDYNAMEHGVQQPIHQEVPEEYRSGSVVMVDVYSNQPHFHWLAMKKSNRDIAWKYKKAYASDAPEQTCCTTHPIVCLGNGIFCCK